MIPFVRRRRDAPGRLPLFRLGAVAAGVTVRDSHLLRVLVVANVCDVGFCVVSALNEPNENPQRVYRPHVRWMCGMASCTAYYIRLWACTTPARLVVYAVLETKRKVLSVKK